MLTMDDIKYIKRMYECEGISIREIMRRTGYHYETVKKYIDRNDFNEPIHMPKKPTSGLSTLFNTFFIRSYLQVYTQLESYSLKNYECVYYYTIIHNFLILT